MGKRARKQTVQNMARKTLAERFWANVLGEPNSGCWLWMGAASGAGYGQTSDCGTVLYAHRVSWELHNGPIPGGMYLLHRCDTPLCANPAHLRLGTQTDNMADCKAKNRTAVGTMLPISKLSPASVLEIRRRLSSGEMQKSIAGDFGVTQSIISGINTGKWWRHVQ